MGVSRSLAVAVWLTISPPSVWTRASSRHSANLALPTTPSPPGLVIRLWGCREGGLVPNGFPNAGHQFAVPQRPACHGDTSCIAAFCNSTPPVFPYLACQISPTLQVRGMYFVLFYHRCMDMAFSAFHLFYCWAKGAKGVFKSYTAAL